MFLTVRKLTLNQVAPDNKYTYINYFIFELLKSFLNNLSTNLGHLKKNYYIFLLKPIFFKEK